MIQERNLAGERNKHILEINNAQAYLSQAASDWAQHVRDVHKSWPASPCHDCMSFQQGIQSNQKFIALVQLELESLR